MQILPPKTVAVTELNTTVQHKGYGMLNATSVAEWAGCQLNELQALSPDWDNMPADNYLKDGGRYRRRRHSCFIQDGGQLVQTPHRAHWQPVEYNALHGGMQRLFEPIEAQVLAQPAWHKLVGALGQACSAARARTSAAPRAACPSASDGSETRRTASGGWCDASLRARICARSWRAKAVQ